MANSNGKKTRKQQGLNRHQLKGHAAKKRQNKEFQNYVSDKNTKSN